MDETWSRRATSTFSIGHVNLTLGSRPPAIGTRINDGEQLTVDFLPPPDLRGINWRVIDEKTIVAMYMNNRAAESLAAGRTDDAYWFAREAIRQDPDFMAPYNTLGVVYQRGGHLEEAARIFAYALEREPRNTHVMSNLVPVLASLGPRRRNRRRSSAGSRSWSPIRRSPSSTEGVAAMRDGDYRAARDLFAKEVDRAPVLPRVPLLARPRARQASARRSGARRHLALAMENSTTRKDHDLYAAKLDRIRSSRLH